MCTCYLNLSLNSFFFFFFLKQWAVMKGRSRQQWKLSECLCIISRRFLAVSFSSCSPSAAVSIPHWCEQLLRVESGQKTKEVASSLLNNHVIFSKTTANSKRKKKSGYYKKDVKITRSIWDAFFFLLLVEMKFWPSSKAANARPSVPHPVFIVPRLSVCFYNLIWD